MQCVCLERQHLSAAKIHVLIGGGEEIKKEMAKGQCELHDEANKVIE